MSGEGKYTEKAAEIILLAARELGLDYSDIEQEANAMVMATGGHIVQPAGGKMDLINEVKRLISQVE
jgi:hypothetical protein